MKTGKTECFGREDASIFTFTFGGRCGTVADGYFSSSMYSLCKAMCGRVWSVPYSSLFLKYLPGARRWRYPGISKATKENAGPTEDRHGRPNANGLRVLTALNGFFWPRPLGLLLTVYIFFKKKKKIISATL